MSSKSPMSRTKKVFFFLLVSAAMVQLFLTTFQHLRDLEKEQYTPYVVAPVTSDD